MIGLGLGLVRQAVRNASGQAWTPAQLFSSGEQGVWYEPKPEYLYQDAAGTTPVTADGDPVGLMLDLSKGLKLGPELVDTAQWSSASSSYVVDGDTVEKTASDDSLFVITDQGPVGSTVEITLEFENLRDGTPVIVTNGDTNTTYPNYVMTGYSGSFVLTTRQEVTDNNIGIYGTEAKWKILSASIRELPGNHATQSTSAARPIYRTDGTLHWLEFDGVDDGLNLPNIDVGGSFISSVAALSTVTKLYTGLLSSGIGGYLGTRQSGAAWGTYDGDDRVFGDVGATPDIVTMSVTDRAAISSVNGVSGDSWVNATLQSYTYLGSFDGNDNFKGQLYGVISRDEPGNALDIEQYLANLAGITL